MGPGADPPVAAAPQAAACFPSSGLGPRAGPALHTGAHRLRRSLTVRFVLSFFREHSKRTCCNYFPFTTLARPWPPSRPPSLRVVTRRGPASASNSLTTGDCPREGPC